MQIVLDKDSPRDDNSLQSVPPKLTSTDSSRSPEVLNAEA
jgi:hypothetical protein